MTKTSTMRGFTLVELVLVITMLGILAVAAFPSFINVADAAESASMQSSVAAIRDAIANERAENIISNGLDADFPTNLGDGVSAITDCSQEGCFTGILVNPLYDQRWSFDGGTDYTYTQDDGTNYTYSYDSSDGSFDEAP